jgi:hypothetical protein
MKYLLIGLVLAFITCCKKTDSLDAELAKLPPITQIGANTFGCLVNGKAVTPNCNLPNCPPPLVGDYDNNPNGYFGIVCNYNSGDNAVIIGLDSILTYRSYEIRDSINKKVRVSIFNKSIADSCRFVGLGPIGKFTSVTGNVTLTRVDVQNGIFSGTFNFTIKTQNCGNYEVTNGRFDYKF